MILFDLHPTENDRDYQALQVGNLTRQYSFLRSIVDTAIAVDRPYLSQTVIKAFNYHAIVCLHAGAGEYRPCEVQVGSYQPPMWIRVQALMDDFVNDVNWRFKETDAITLASYVLWQINHIHPFVNGNGRTARITAYFVLCLKLGGLLKGKITLPDLLRRERGESHDPYVSALKAADRSAQNGALDLTELEDLVTSLLEEQLNSADD